MPDSPPPSTSSPQKTGEDGRILRASILISGATFLSRLLGFARDMLLARLFGAGVAADAFFVAYRIPNMLRELFAEGSMSAAFIPVFSEYRKRRSHQDAKDLANAAFTAFLLIMTAMCILGVLGAPVVVYLIAMGFSDDPEKQALTIQLTRLMFPYLIFIGLSALAMGILNTLRSFAAPALAPVMFNLAIISCALFLAPQLEHPIYGIAIGVVLGGLAQFLVQIPHLRKFDFAFVWRWQPTHPGVLRIGKLIIPTVFGLGITQANILVNTILASFLVTGSVTYLFYGMRLIHFPLGLVGIALATAILPSLSDLTADGARQEVNTRVEFGLRHVLFLMIPATVGLIMLRTPLIQLFFEHGEFTATATQGTADAVLFYAVGLWAFGAIRIVVSAFYALQDTRTPVAVAMLALVCNVLFSLFLMGPLQHGGLALATSLATMINVFTLIVLLRRKIGPLNWHSLLYSVIRTSVASCVVVAVCYAVTSHALWNQDGQSLMKGMLLGGGVVFSISGYLGVQRLMRSVEFSAMWDAISKRSSPC